MLAGEPLDPAVAGGDGLGDGPRRPRTVGSSRACSTRSRSSRRSASTGRMRAALAPMICTQSPGSLAAMRVTSRTPPPARSSEPSGASCSRAAMSVETLRGVRDVGDGLVVRLRRHRHDRGTDVERQVLDHGGALVRDRVVAGDHPRPSDEQVRARGGRPGALPPRHRVRPDVAGDVGRCRHEPVERSGLHARHVRDDRTRVGRELALDDGGHDVRRHRDDDELRVVPVGGTTTGP